MAHGRTIAHDNFICLLLLRQQYKFSHTWASDAANLFCFVLSSLLGRLWNFEGVEV
jgi:hypothetical protein